MAPSYHDSDSSDEEGAPEAVSLAQSKQRVQQHNDQLQKVQLAQKEKKKQTNRERDRKLKERAEKTRGKKKDDKLESRMARAMQEGQEEMDNSEDDAVLEGFAAFGSEAGSGDSMDEDSEGDSEDGFYNEDEEMGSDDDDDDDFDDEEENGELPKPKSKSNPNHLPDELFTAAFSSKPIDALSKPTGAKNVQQSTSKRRKRTNTTPKDVLVGSRAIRTLQTASRPSISSTVAPRKVRKFLDRALALKGGNSKKGWERRPANIGVLRQSGPAANFVRNR
ncbi:hypothetical protein BDQ12DRAFT_651239 [Crucibulum laeve]|uniref:Uncharacterized protein n=1 Tax=Crucibulum laeve TaxID=68775 RepID=A0A5C3M061_9AGAR|nr:hypothetical protein BDQ12DRAFT_651239 [Crucibulum laeve]